MTFDIIIGNPPYNNDVYLDFVTLGDKLSNTLSCFITPAKWQAKSGLKNTTFRNSIVPKISHITVYKDSKDIFDIEEWGGICYYTVTKSKVDTPLVRSICKKNKHLNCDYEIHTEKPLILLPNTIISILNKFNQYESLGETLNFNRQTYLGEQDSGTNNSNSPIQVLQGDKVVGYTDIDKLRTTENLEKYKITCSIMPGAVSELDNTGRALGIFKTSLLLPHQVPKGSFPILRFFSTQSKAESFISYLNTTTVSFLYFLGCCGTTLTREFFRLVPLPPSNNSFDHEYTDSELYEIFNLTPNDIEIIESTIRKR